MQVYSSCKAQVIGRAKPNILGDQILTKQILLCMKLTALFLFATIFQVSGKGFSQEKISISVDNAPLEKVLTSITRQSGYYFVYREEMISHKKVTVHCADVTLKEALDLCLKSQRLSYSIVGKSIVITPPQDGTVHIGKIVSSTNNFPFIDVKGRVVNEKGEPVEGVSVVVKGSGKTTLTDANGEFALLTVDRNATLIFTHISLESFEVKVQGKSELAITLRTKISALGDVTITVNTGYQQLPKERATGSFTQIDNRTFNLQVSTNVIGRLDGIASGLTIDKKRASGSRTGISIQGISTITGPQEPLIILDNFPYEGNINNINPNDIESITILKDAAAASIWGARSGNGVIILTTKKGKFNQPFSVEFNSNVTVINKPDLFYRKPISTSDYIDVESFLFSKQYRFSDTSNVYRPPFSPVYEILFKEKNGQITSASATEQINKLRNLDVRNEYNKFFYQKAVNQQYSINMRGGSNNAAWILSLGFDNNLNELNANYQRKNIRFSHSLKPLKNLEVFTNLYFTQTSNKSGKPEYGEITSGGSLYPYALFADENGNPLAISKYRQPYIDTAGKGKLLDWNYYPLDDYKSVKSSSKSQDILCNLGLRYKLFSFVTTEISYQYEIENSKDRTMYDLQSFYARDLINSFSQIDPVSNQISYIIPKGAILDLTDGTTSSNKGRGLINLNKNWGRHEINAIAGGEINQTKVESSTSRTYGYNDDNLTFNNYIDYFNTYPTYISGDVAFVPSTNSFNGNTNRFVSIFSNAAYTYNQKYSISLSGRRDASNLFGVNTNQKWTPLWSVGASWDISKEKFYNFSFLPDLKLRASYGYRGNVDQSMSAVTTINYLSTSPYTQTPYANVNRYANPDLKWERIAMINFGLDFKSVSNRIGMSIDFFTKKGSDLYGASPIDYTTGVTNSIVKNAAGMEGTGLNIELNTLNINKEYKWSSTFIFNYYKDKVIKYFSGSDQASNFLYGTNVYSINPVEGHPVYSIYSYKWAGLDAANGDPQGYLNGQVSKDWSTITGAGTKSSDLVYNGPAFPTSTIFFINTFSWKNISLTVDIIGKFNFYFRRESINYSQLFANGDGYSNFSDFGLRWQKAGDEQLTNVPSMIYPSNTNRDNFYTYSESNIEKGDHIRLQFVNLAYEIKRQSLRKLPFKTLKLYLNASNLGIIWRSNDKNLDPDYLSASIPPSKSLAFGLAINF